MKFNAIFNDAEFAVEISRDLVVGFPEYDPEYDQAFVAMGGKATPVEEFASTWAERPMVIIANSLRIPWEALMISLLNYVEHVVPTYRTARSPNPLIQSAIDMARYSLARWGSDGYDYNEFFSKAERTVMKLSELAASLHSASPMRDVVGANMAWAAVCMLRCLTSQDHTTVFILGASKSRTVVREVALHHTRNITLKDYDRHVQNQLECEKHWQVRRAFDVTKAFRDVEAETPEDQRVDLGLVIERAGETP
jgi:hypothetical protein